MTVAVGREQEQEGWDSVLKVSLVGEDGETPVREVTWAFHDLAEDAEMWVAMVVEKPTISERDDLVVRFEQFEVEMRH